MRILLEEAPLLVFHFLTLFLSNYKLRLILSIFWTTSTFWQFELPCSLRLLHSLFALAYARAFALTSVALGARLRLRLCAHFIRAIAPFGRSWRSLTLALKAPLGHYKQALTAFALVYSLVPSISIAPCDFVFHFALYNLAGGGCPSDTLINVHSLCQIRLSNRYVHTASRRRPFWFT